MVDIPPSKLAAAATLTGDEIMEVSQLSASVTISAATISALASDNSFNDSGNGFVAAGFSVGNFVHVTGFTGNLANNIFSGQITVLTAGKMTIGGTDGDVIVDDAAGETVVITKWVSRRATAEEVAATGTMKLIAEQTPSGTGTVSFTSIPATYRDLRLVIRGRGTEVATSTVLLIRLNNDSGANYDRQRLTGANATASAAASVAQTNLFANSPALPAASATANVAGTVIVNIYDYRGTTFQKSADALMNLKFGTTAADLNTMIASGYWRDTSAVNRVDAILNAGNFVAGSVVSLYGVM